MNWDSQGLSDYDGYAWYRLTFSVPSDLNLSNLYLNLGKIDDYDKVYLNGILIGQVEDLKNKSFVNKSTGEYNIRRIYEIPEGLIKRNNNVLAVRVYDGKAFGGIWEGPVGLMSERNYYRYIDKHHENETLFEYIMNEIFDEF